MVPCALRSLIAGAWAATDETKRLGARLPGRKVLGTAWRLRLGIESLDVLEAARTKWDFLLFAPGLVGAHCIGVDPYYLTYKAEEVGYKPQVILGGRAINDGMGKYAGENVVKGLIRRGKTVKGSRVLILGLAFKENVSDVRNSKVRDVIDELREHGVEVVAHDPVVDPGQAEAEFELRPLPLEHVEKSGPHRGCRESSRFPYTDPGQAQ